MRLLRRKNLKVKEARKKDRRRQLEVEGGVEVPEEDEAEEVGEEELRLIEESVRVELRYSDHETRCHGTIDADSGAIGGKIVQMRGNAKLWCANAYADGAGGCI